MRSLVALVVLSFLVGCSGDDGGAGPSGPQGPSGDAGPTGSSGASGAVPVSSAERIEVEITDVSVPAGGGAPIVSLSLTNDLNQGLSGLPAANIRFVISELIPGTGGGSSGWRSYITRDDGGVENVQADTETATAGSYLDNADGTYTYTFSRALTAYPAGPEYDEFKTHRVGVEIRTNSGGFLPDNIPADNAPFDFVPAGGEPALTRRIVDSATCNACHDNLEFHGGARFNVEYCVLCHNPDSADGNSGNSIDMKVMIHKIHYGVNLANGYSIIGYGGSTHDYSDVHFSQDVRNCGTCHDADNEETVDSENWQNVANRAACGTCHDHIDWESGSEGHPGGFVFSDDTQCLDCHGPEATVNGGAVRVANAHALDDQMASAAFAFNILTISDTASGEQPVITYSVTNPEDGDAAYDLLGDDEFTACGSGASRLYVDIGWTSAEYTNTGSGSDLALPVSINALGPGCGGEAVDNSDGTYTVTSPVVVPAGLSGSIGVVLEGHPWVDLDDNGSAGFNERIAVTSAVAYASIDGSPVEERRQQVAIEKCNDCHNRLSAHGNNRTDKPEACVVCHNPNMTDANQHVAGNCAAELGVDDVTIDFKYMIHAIHSGEVSDYEVCGYGNSVHGYADLVYPGRLNNCEGCHQAGGYYPVEPGELHGTTVDSFGNSDPTDDTVISPNTAVCSSCHVDSLAIEHMKQNGGDFEATKAADSSLVSVETETCVLCHGPGRTADVKVVHGVGEFRFN